MKKSIIRSRSINPITTVELEAVRGGFFNIILGALKSGTGSTLQNEDGQTESAIIQNRNG